MSKTTISAILAVVVLTLLIYINENKNDLSENTLKSNPLILAFGDSLTYGFGASPAFSYPALLGKKSGLHVINAGINGEESAEGLERLPELLKQKPDLVILCHGGNDILRQRSQVELKNNLLSMIKLIKESGAIVLFVGVPDFNLVGFKTLPLYSDIAKESGVIYEDEILTYIETRQTLKSDYVHPNEKGYEMMADTFMKIIHNHTIRE